MSEPLKYFADTDDQPPFLKALAEVRHMGVHEGWCYHHVQAIILSIDQYVEAATGNRDSSGISPLDWRQQEGR